MEGVVILLVAIGAATVFGLWRQRSDGRFRAGPSAPGDSEPLVVDGRPVEATERAAEPWAPAGEPDEPDPSGVDRDAVESGARSVAGSERGPGAVPGADLGAGVVPGSDLGADPGARSLTGADLGAEPRADALTRSDLGADPGARATLVQFSSAFCQPCRATRAVLGEVAGLVPGVVHVEIDAESRLDLVRRLDVTRTPTVLILDRTGAIRRRAVGAPRKADVLAALADVV
jgi:thiol-disulfide isomerase/thioredoxin